MSAKQGKPKFLVVDDDKQLVDVFFHIMKQLHCEADFLTDPDKVLKAIERDPDYYDLIITDIRMPGVDGLSLARKVRTHSPNVPFIFMTGFPSEEAKQEIKEMGRATYLEKPFALHDLIEKVIPGMLNSNS